MSWCLEISQGDGTWLPWKPTAKELPYTWPTRQSAELAIPVYFPVTHDLGQIRVAPWSGQGNWPP